MPCSRSPVSACGSCRCAWHRRPPRPPRKLEETIMTALRIVLPLACLGLLAACGPRVTPEQNAQGVTAFATVEKVFQHPRCRNCHIPGDQPLQFDEGLPHQMLVVRGAEGKGAPGLTCASCHNIENAPASYGPNAPPGAPNWHLPPPEHKMAWI